MTGKVTIQMVIDHLEKVVNAIQSADDDAVRYNVDQMTDVVIKGIKDDDLVGIRAKMSLEILMLAKRFAKMYSNQPVANAVRTAEPKERIQLA